MKIRKMTKDNTVPPRVFDREGAGGAPKAALPFSEQLQKVQAESVQREMESLLSDIDKQGKILTETMNIKDVKKYKDLIHRFLDFAVNQMYKISEESGWDRRGRHKVYALIETVNKELENLTTMLLKDQKDHLEILSKIDEIRGLLVDIYS